jgi:hypothetical protein
MGTTSEARKRREEAAASATPCIHSGFEPDCIGCWKGLAALQEQHITRVREIVVDAGATMVLHAHDMHWFGQDWERSLRTP